MDKSERPYFVLFVRTRNEANRYEWSYEFGDYDRTCVTQECADWLDHYDEFGRVRRKKDTVVLKLRTADQWRIDAILSALRAYGTRQMVINMRDLFK